MAKELHRADILVIEDDENLRVAVVDNLTAEGYVTVAAATAAQALAAVGEHHFELLVLDLMLPDGDGYSLCERLRRDGLDAMILMLTARTLEEDLVRGFEVGADDYLRKPYRLRELLSRVKALLRRRGVATAGALGFAGFHLDLDARVLRDSGGHDVELTRTEFDLLALLVRHRGRTLSRHDILERVWGQGLAVDPHTVDNFVSALKKKLGWTPEARWRIESVRGIGYRMDVDEG
jgi:DNA-binding response OmpR family regulator